MRPLTAIACALSLATPALAALAPGAAAPDFTTDAALNGVVTPIRLAALLKKGPVVLYFFPLAYTGGCNAEAHAFAEAVPDFAAAGATVIGMSADPIATLSKFSQEKCAGKFAVATAGADVIRRYGVAMAGGPIKAPDGSMRAITNRTSFVIAPNGRIAFAYTNNSPLDHVRLTLDAVRKLKR